MSIQDLIKQANDLAVHAATEPTDRTDDLADAWEHVYSPCEGSCERWARRFIDLCHVLRNRGLLPWCKDVGTDDGTRFYLRSKAHIGHESPRFLGFRLAAKFLQLAIHEKNLDEIAKGLEGIESAGRAYHADPRPLFRHEPPPDGGTVTTGAFRLWTIVRDHEVWSPPMKRVEIGKALDQDPRVVVDGPLARAELEWCIEHDSRWFYSTRGDEPRVAKQVRRWRFSDPARMVEFMGRLQERRRL